MTRKYNRENVKALALHWDGSASLKAYIRGVVAGGGLGSELMRDLSTLFHSTEYASVNTSVLRFITFQRGEESTKSILLFLQK